VVTFVVTLNLIFIYLTLNLLPPVIVLLMITFAPAHIINAFLPETGVAYYGVTYLLTFLIVLAVAAFLLQEHRRIN